MHKEILRKHNINVTGAGKQPIIFAHGFGCDQNMWRFVAPAFEADYRVILFDYVGCGKSDRNAFDREQYSSLAGYAKDVIEIIDELDVTNAIFVGHSVSSMIGILASIQRPERFSDLILIAPSPRYINDPPCYNGGFEESDINGLFDMMDKNFLGWANFLAPVVMKNPDQPDLSKELEESFCASDPVMSRQFAETTFYSDNRDDLPKVIIPSLIMQCTEDSIAPLSVGEYLHQKLPKSNFRLMQATGHCPHMSHPEETIEIIKDYLASQRL